MRTPPKVLLRAGFFFACQIAGATAYTVKSSGGDFTTLSAAAAVAVAGDKVTVFASASPQSGWTQPSSGSAGNLITFTVNSGDAVSITSTVTISSRSYIDIDHFSFSAVGILGNGSSAHNVIDSNIFNGNATAFRINDGLGTGGSDNVFSNNSVTIPNANLTASIYLFGDRNRIEGNTIVGGDDDCMDIGGANVVVRNNVCTGKDGTASGGTDHIDFIQVIGAGTSPTLSFSLVENNTEKGCTNDGGNCHFIIIRTGTGPVADTDIVRFNYAQNLDAQGPISFGGAGDSVPNGWFYNNSIAPESLYNGNGACASWQNAAAGAAFNNLCYNTATGNSSFSPFFDFSGGGMVENGNLVFTTSYSGAWNTPYSSEATYASLHNANPLLANYPTDDSLQASSPAIGAGVALTTASSSGSSSTALTAANAHGFQPGWAGTNADWIRIGASATVQISAINYSTNVITLATPQTWSNGDSIYLYKDSSGNVKLNGAKPNVGAALFAPSAPCAACFARSEYAPQTESVPLEVAQMRRYSGAHPDARDSRRLRTRVHAEPDSLPLH